MLCEKAVDRLALEPSAHAVSARSRGALIKHTRVKMRSAWPTMVARNYDHLNSTRPLLIKGATSGALLGAGDITCQLLEKHESVDRARVVRMLGWGALFNGPLGHLWYQGLDWAVRLKGARGVAAKVLLDQLVYTPPLTFGYFVWQHALSSGSGLPEACRSASERLWPTLHANWLYWSVVHVATFTLVPLNYRVAFISTKNFFWANYLSWVGNVRKNELH